MALCPVHGTEYEAVEQREVEIKSGFHQVVRGQLLVTKKVCSMRGCREVIFVDTHQTYGIVLEGLTDFPKDSRLVWKKEV